MNKLSYLALSSVVVLIVFGCKPNEPESTEPQQAELTKEYVLKRMMAYFPYTADGVYTYVNDATGQEWTIRPYTSATSTHTFPEVMSESFMEGVPQWDEWINAEFNADGINNTYRTTQFMHINTTSKGTFDFRFQFKIRMGLNDGYGGSMNQLACDTAAILSLLIDTITLPFKSQYDNRNFGHAYNVPNAQMHIVKGKGLTDFSIDGQSTWHLVEK